MNNIFTFATGELSQDAFICWLFNWFNDGSNIRLKNLIIDFCSEKLKIHDIRSIDIYRQFSRKVDDNGKKYSVKIDVLLIINKDTAIIIEDKTFTSEHSGQISRYEEGLKALLGQNTDHALFINEESYIISKIMTVYWKTGFFYDYDYCVKADCTVNSEYLITKLSDYRNDSELIDMYVQSLVDTQQWYSDHSKYWELYLPHAEKSVWNTNISRHHIAQYKMMREFFPIDMWNKKDHYYVEQGTSSGRPWTEIWIYHPITDEGSEISNDFQVFWRIDTDTKGSYISLRLYKPYKGYWDGKYSEFKKTVEDYINRDGFFTWETINPGKTDSYKEAAIAHFELNEKVWLCNKDKIISTVRALNNEVEQFAVKNYGPNKYENE